MDGLMHCSNSDKTLNLIFFASPTSLRKCACCLTPSMPKVWLYAPTAITSLSYPTSVTRPFLGTLAGTAALVASAGDGGGGSVDLDRSST